MYNDVLGIPKIRVEDAVLLARAALVRILSSDLEYIRVEEVFPPSHMQARLEWTVTMSFLEQSDAQGKLERTMRVITLDEDGSFVSMRIRNRHL